MREREMTDRIGTMQGTCNPFKDVLDQLYDGLYLVDRHRTLTYWNRASEQITGFTADEVLGRRCSDNLLTHIDQSGQCLCYGQCPVARTLEDGIGREAQVYLHHKAGHRVPVLVRVSAIRDAAGNIVGAAELFTDNSSKGAMLEKIAELEQLAVMDPLTRLANRHYTEKFLDSRLNEMTRYGWPLGVLFVDIDHFKGINDSHGHAFGDKVLQMVARTLVNNLRSFDLLGRWGGEEFLAVISQVDRAALYHLAERLRVLVREAYLVMNGTPVSVTVSVGATLARTGDTIETVTHRADLLMYKSKERGRNCVTISED